MLLVVDSVSLHRNDKTLLDQVSFSLEKGRILTLIGPNGAGKTTLVKIILGLMKPDAGSVKRAPGIRIGYMPQRLVIDPTLPLTVGGFLKLTDRDPASCKTALDWAGVKALWLSPLYSLSGGETQRVMLARALLCKPDLLVLDEPVQGVDVAGQEQLYRLIARIRRDLGCGILMVSHDLHLVMAATDEVICLNQHVCCHGSPEQVSSDPEFTELFGNRTALYTHHHDHGHDLHGEIVSESGMAAANANRPSTGGRDSEKGTTADQVAARDNVGQG